MKKLLRISKAIVVFSLLLSSMMVKAQPYPIEILENFNIPYATSTMPAGWIDSNLTRTYYPNTPPNYFFRSPGHQLGGWALGPDSPATGSLHGVNNILPFDATDGFLYSRADSAMGPGPNFGYQYDSFVTIDNWVFLPVDSLSQATQMWFSTSTDPGLIANNFKDSLQVYLNVTDTSMDTTKYIPWPVMVQAPPYPTLWTQIYGTANVALVPTPRIGRVAFRHIVKGDVTGAKSWFVAIDDIIVNTWPVPIEFSNLWCKPDKNNNVNVYWETATENNSDYFIVERSVDGKNFKQLGKVKAAGNSSLKHEYSFADVSAASAGFNTVMYRIRQYDLNGKYGLSPVVTAKLTSTGVSNMVLPFMAGNNLRVRFMSESTGNANILVFNSNGQKVAEVNQGVNEGLNIADIDFGSMAPGMYTVRVTNNRETMINRFIK